MSKVDFKSGEIVYNEFNISVHTPLYEQEHLLLEDLLQVEYCNGILLDVGWYPEFDVNGRFVVQIIKNKDWSSPIYKKECMRIECLIDELNFASVIAEEAAGRQG